MKKIHNGGLGECVILKEHKGILLVCVLDTRYNQPFAVAEDYNVDFECWARSGYYPDIHEAIADFDNRVKANGG